MPGGMEGLDGRRRGRGGAGRGLILMGQIYSCKGPTIFLVKYSLSPTVAIRGGVEGIVPSRTLGQVGEGGVVLDILRSIYLYNGLP